MSGATSETTVDPELSATIVFSFDSLTALYLVYIRSLPRDMTASFRNPLGGIKMQINTVAWSVGKFFSGRV